MQDFPERDTDAKDNASALCEAPAVSDGCSAWRALGTAKTVTRVP